MKAMILAAGRGERMRPLTDIRPKPLLKVDGQTLIEWHIQALKAAGIREILINTSWLGEQIPEYLGDGAYWGVKLSFSHEDTALETAGGIRKALDFFDDEPFIVVNSDVWTDFDYANLLLKPPGLAHLVLVPNPEQHPQGDFALNGEIVSEYGESSWTFSGIGLYQPSMFAELELDKAEPLGPLLRHLMQEQHVTGELYRGRWHDIGTPERLKALNEALARKISDIDYPSDPDKNTGRNK